MEGGSASDPAGSTTATQPPQYQWVASQFPAGTSKAPFLFLLFYVGAKECIQIELYALDYQL